MVQKLYNKKMAFLSKGNRKTASDIKKPRKYTTHMPILKKKIYNQLKSSKTKDSKNYEVIILKGQTISIFKNVNCKAV